MGLLERIRKFFYSDDEIVKLAGGLSEPEAEMWRELLQNNGIPAMVKNMGGEGVGYQYGGASMFTRNYDLFVKRSDFVRAQEIYNQGP